MFSTRVPPDLAPNRLTLAVEAARAAGNAIIDLTETNPTRVGLSYPETLLEPLAGRASLRYEPEPFGLRAAREAVSAEYAAAALEVDPCGIVLTASTSEAYSFLFKLLCDAGRRGARSRPVLPAVRPPLPARRRWRRARTPSSTTARGRST